MREREKEMIITESSCRSLTGIAANLSLWALARLSPLHVDFALIAGIVQCMSHTDGGSVGDGLCKLSSESTWSL